MKLTRENKKLLERLNITEDSEGNLIYINADSFHVIRFLSVFSEHREFYQEFEIYCIETYDEKTGEPSYHEKGVSHYPCNTEKLSNGERFVIGSIKWDGCSHINFDDTYFHGCSRKDLLDIGKILALTHEMCIALMGREDEYED